MAGVGFTEELKFYTSTVVNDGQGGKTKSGETLSYTAIAIIKEKPLTKSNADGQLTFNKLLTAEIWKNPNFTSTETTSVEYRGKRYSIQDITDNDLHTKQILTLVARV